MTIALLAALGIGEFFTALIITVFVLVAEVLEGLTVGRGRRAIGDLARFVASLRLDCEGWGVAHGDSGRRTSRRRQGPDSPRNENPR